MSFASDIREEICKFDIDEVCCARAELVGMVFFGAVIKRDEIRIRTESECVAKRFYDLVRFLYNIEVKLTSKNNVYYAEFLGDEVLKVIRDMKLGGVPMRIDKEIVRNECCKSAILRGIFLGGGSMTDPTKGYHIELVCNHYFTEKDLRGVFEHFDLYPKVINRKGNYVFYIKESYQIENFLAAIGSYKKMMEFVNVVIERGIKNSTNRRVNFEIANYTKSYESALKQQMAIKKIVLERGWQSLSPELLSVAKLRIEDPYMSLSEMAKKLNVSKSGVNHRMRRILELAQMDNK